WLPVLRRASLRNGARGDEALEVLRGAAEQIEVDRAAADADVAGVLVERPPPEPSRADLLGEVELRPAPEPGGVGAELEGPAQALVEERLDDVHDEPLRELRGDRLDERGREARPVGARERAAVPRAVGLLQVDDR